MKIGFIGCGNMGGALARAISTAPDTEILLCDRDEQKAKALAEATGGATRDSEEIAALCDFIFIGVKPYGVAELLRGLAPKLKMGGAVVSMAAGVTLGQIAEAIGYPYPAVRIMPNTPVAYGEGMTLASPSGEVTEEIWNAFWEIMKPTGRLDRLDEGLMDAASAVSGSGPAFVYMFLEALARGGEAVGLPYEKALSYAAQTLRGAVAVVEKSGKDTERLRIEVCSPGGSTIEGVKRLVEGELHRTVTEAVKVTYEKARTLGK